MNASPAHSQPPADGPRPVDPRKASRAARDEQTHRLLLEAASTTDAARREELLDQVVILNRSVAEAIANRYRGRGVAHEDLEQAAFEGLVKAVHKFDPAVRPHLLTYAVPTMRGEIQRWFRDQSWMVRPPRRIQEMQWKVSRSIDHLSQQLGRDPTTNEIREDIGCSTHEVDDALQAFGAFQPPSLDRPISESGHLTMGDLIPDEDDDALSTAEARATLEPVVRQLSQRDRRILYLRFYEDQSQAEIGDQLGVTQMQVSRLLVRILTDLRRQLTAVPQRC